MTDRPRHAIFAPMDYDASMHVDADGAVTYTVAVSPEGLPAVRGVWSEGAFSRFSHEAENEFGWLPGWARPPLVRTCYGLGWLDCGFWGPSVNPISSPW